MDKSPQLFNRSSFLLIFWSWTFHHHQALHFHLLLKFHLNWKKRIPKFPSSQNFGDLEANQRSWKSRNGPCFQIHMTSYCQKDEKFCFQDPRSKPGLLGYMWSLEKSCWAWQMRQGYAKILLHLQQKLAKLEATFWSFTTTSKLISSNYHRFCTLWLYHLFSSLLSLKLNYRLLYHYCHLLKNSVLYMKWPNLKGSFRTLC